MIKIGIDAISLTKNPSGVGRYLLGIIENLQQNGDFQIILFSNREIITNGLCLRNNVKFIVDNRKIAKIKSLIWLRYFSGSIISDYNLDFFISNLGFLPKLKKQVKKIVIVHDLNYKMVPKTMGFTHFLAHYFWLKKDVRSADYIVTNSLGTAEKIKLYFKKAADAVIHPRVEFVEERPKKTVPNNLILPSRFILSVGNMEPRKNLNKVILMFERLKELLDYKDVKLILAGGGGWKNEKLKAQIDVNDDIISLGYVSDADLGKLYRSAAVFVFPSIYEGFGIPLREAILSGCPAVASDIPELREAGNDDCLYIDPDNTLEFVEAVLKSMEKKNISNHFSLINETELLIKFLYGSRIEK